MSTPAPGGHPTPDTPADIPATTPATTARSGRRSATPSTRGRGLDRTLVVAVVVVLVTAGLAALTRTDASGPGTAAAPDAQPLTRTTVVCPAYGDDVRATTTTDAEGSLVARSGGDAQDVPMGPQRSARVTATDGRAVVLRAEDDLAPGLVASRAATPAAVAPCGSPTFDQWFTGVGAGAEHASVLELTNPDGGRAVVDVTVLGRNGPVDVPRLQGLAVPGDETVQLDLAEVVPRREDLTVRVQTSRGRVSSALLDRVTAVGEPALGPDWLAPQAEPSTSNVVLGTPAGEGDRFLTLANPGSDEGRARIEVVTGSAVFAPEGSEEVVVPPQSTVRVPVGDVLAPADDAADDEVPVGLQVTSTVPVTAAVRSEVGGDLALATAGVPTDRPVAALVTGGPKQLVVAGADDAGTVTVRAWSGGGRALPEQELDMEVGRASTLALPGGARLVVLTSDGPAVTSAVVVGGDGAAVVAPGVLQVTGSVPQVRPGLP